MGLREQLRRLKREARGELESFELLDGSRYYFDPLSWDHIMHYFECLGKSAHDWPEPPEIARKLCEAKDPERALEQVAAGGWNVLAYDPEILINERRLEPRPLVTRYGPETGKHHPRDPYEDPQFEDLSEP